MSEDLCLARARLAMMARGDSKWDLSPNDITAIATVLAALQAAEAGAEGEGEVSTLEELKALRDEPENVVFSDPKRLGRLIDILIAERERASEPSPAVGVWEIVFDMIAEAKAIWATDLTDQAFDKLAVRLRAKRDGAK